MKVVIANTAALNTGDAAILFATLEILNQTLRRPLDVTAFDLQPAAAARRYPELRFRSTLFDDLRAWAGGGWRLKAAAGLVLLAARLRRTGLRGLGARLVPAALGDRLEELHRADLVLSAGGTYLVPHYRTPAKVFDLLAVLAAGRPLVLFTQSLGPFRKRKGNRLLRYMLRRADLILVRDSLSRRHLEEIGVRPQRIVECADAAFALSPPLVRKRHAAGSNRRLRVAVSVRDWPHFEEAGRDGMQPYMDAVASAVRHLVERHEAEVTFISTCQGVPEYWTDDSRVADSVVERLPADARRQVRVDRAFHTPQDLMRRLASFDMVVATRMHVAILALCAGVPVLPIAYEFKTSELFGKLGLEKFVLRIDRVTAEAAREAIDAFLIARSEICAMLPSRVMRERRSAFVAGQSIRNMLRAAG